MSRIKIRDKNIIIYRKHLFYDKKTSDILKKKTTWKLVVDVSHGSSGRCVPTINNQVMSGNES